MKQKQKQEQEQKQENKISIEGQTIEEVTDKLLVILKLNSENEWNLSARELMSRIRRGEQLYIQMQSLFKEFFINNQSVIESMREIKKKTPTFKIVANNQEEEILTNGKEEESPRRER